MLVINTAAASVARSVAANRAASGSCVPACRTRPAAIGRVFLLCESRQPPFPRPRILLIARVVAATVQGRLDVSICAAETAENLTATSSDSLRRNEKSRADAGVRARARYVSSFRGAELRDGSCVALRFWQSTRKNLPFAFFRTRLALVRACARAIGTIERRLLPKVAERCRRLADVSGATSRIPNSEYRILPSFGCDSDALSRALAALIRAFQTRIYRDRTEIREVT